MIEDIIKIMKDAQKQRHKNMSNGQKKRQINDLLLALEFGFKQCEKGNNLIYAKEHFVKILRGKQIV